MAQAGAAKTNMITKIKTHLGKFIIDSLERHGLTLVPIGLPRVKPGDWFSIKKIVRSPHDGSWRGDLFRADKVEGAFVAATRFDGKYGVGGRGSKQCLLLSDYEIQTLTKGFVLSLRPELAEAAKQGGGAS